jgi:hypothetical protein
MSIFILKRRKIMSKETIQIKALIQTELDTDGTLKKVSGI